MTEQEEQWLTGFLEGDGSVGVYHNLVVTFSQKNRDILDYISTLIHSGHIYCSRRNQHTLYNLRVNGRYCVPLLETFSRHVVSRCTSERLSSIQNVAISMNPPTLDWLAGFWDAEGSSSNSPGLYLSQKDKEVLEAVEEKFGGKVYKSGTTFQWALLGEGARTFATELAPRSHNTQKVSELLKHFNGPTYNQLHADERKPYDRQYYSEHKERAKERYNAHRDTRLVQARTYNKKHWEVKKSIQDYIKSHPEEVERIRQKHDNG